MFNTFFMLSALLIFSSVIQYLVKITLINHCTGPLPTPSLLFIIKSELEGVGVGVRVCVNVCNCDEVYYVCYDWQVDRQKS